MSKSLSESETGPVNAEVAARNDGGDSQSEIPESAIRPDGLNRRIAKTDKTGESDVTYDYYYNESWQAVEVRKDSDTDPYKQYVWDLRYIDAPVLRWRDGNTDGDLDDEGDDTLYYCNDANPGAPGNVTCLVDTGGDAVERVTYDPYGKVTIYGDDWSDTVDWADSKKNEILYCGYYWDNETGQYHVRHRYLHPTLGRWLSRDPSGYADGMSLYEYVGSSPTCGNDPAGLYTYSQDTLDQYHQWAGMPLYRPAPRKEADLLQAIKQAAENLCEAAGEKLSKIGPRVSACSAEGIASGKYFGFSASAGFDIVVKVGGGVWVGCDALFLCKPCKVCTYGFVKVKAEGGAKKSVGVVFVGERGRNVYKPEDYASLFLGVQGGIGALFGAEGGYQISPMTGVHGVQAGGSAGTGTTWGGSGGVSASWYWLVGCADPKR